MIVMIDGIAVKIHLAHNPLRHNPSRQSVTATFAIANKQLNATLSICCVTAGVVYEYILNMKMYHRLRRDLLAGAARQPLSVSKSGQAARNVIMWCDHRAADRLRRSVCRGARRARCRRTPVAQTRRTQTHVAQRDVRCCVDGACASRSSSSTSSHSSAPARSRGR